MASKITSFVTKSARNLVSHQQVAVRCMSGANPKILESQKKFLKEDDTPVHLKGGPLDQVLYRTTLGACILAIGSFIYNMYEMAVPKAK